MGSAKVLSKHSTGRKQTMHLGNPCHYRGKQRLCKGGHVIEGASSWWCEAERLATTAVHAARPLAKRWCLKTLEDYAHNSEQ
jgi:hypothetical protein